MARQEIKEVGEYYTLSIESCSRIQASNTELYPTPEQAIETCKAIIDNLDSDEKAIIIKHMIYRSSKRGLFVESWPIKEIAGRKLPEVNWSID